MSEGRKQTVATITATAAFLLLGWIAHGMQELRNDVKTLRENMNVRLERMDERLDNLELNQVVLLERTVSLALARPGTEPLTALASGTADRRPAVDAL